MPADLLDNPIPTKSLRCVSFHSVKGGVGKSTLSYLVARAFAKRGPVALIDTDLTGTSLADVLPLRPPQWGNESMLPLSLPPERWGSVEAGRNGLKSRAAEEKSYARYVPLLNDFLLWQEHRHEPEKDIHPLALSWKLNEGDSCEPNLWVLPSSALPNDLNHMLHVIYDELHAGFLESRLEWLLHFILERTDIRTVVFDTPPTIPGLSRAILSMAMRLPDYKALCEDGTGTPLELTKEKTCPIEWIPCLITSPDLQDMRAAERWLENIHDNERKRIRVVLNGVDRDWADEERPLKDLLIDSPGVEEGPEYSGSLLREAPVCVRSTGELRIFRGNGAETERPLAVGALKDLFEAVGATLP